MNLLVLLMRYNVPTETWLYRMTKGIGPDLKAIAGRSIGDGNFPEIPVPFVKLRSRNFLYKSLPKSIQCMTSMCPTRILAKALDCYDIDTVLCHYGTVCLENEEALRASTARLFVHFHGFDQFFDLKTKDGSGENAHPPEYKARILDLSTRATFITNSEYSKSLLTDIGCDPAKIFVKPYGVEAAPSPKQHEEKEWPVIAHVGRMVDFKSPDRTIKAFHLLRERGVKAKLVMAGGGDLLEECQKLAAEGGFSEDITFLGRVQQDQVQEVLRDTDIFTAHNVYGDTTGQAEAFGVTNIEAMAWGIPTVGTRSGGVLETIVNGETGILVEPGDVVAHANALQRLVEDVELRRTYGLAGWNRVKTHFSPELEQERLRAILTRSLS